MSQGVTKESSRMVELVCRLYHLNQGGDQKEFKDHRTSI